MPSMSQLTSHSLWAKSSLAAVLEQRAGAQSLNTNRVRNWSLDPARFFWAIVKSCTFCKVLLSYMCSILLINSYWAGWQKLPEIVSTLALQALFHSTKDGGLCSLHCCLGKNPEDLHCYLYALMLVSPQIRLDHSRVQRKDTDASSCSMNKGQVYIYCSFESTLRTSSHLVTL